MMMMMMMMMMMIADPPLGSSTGTAIRDKNRKGSWFSLSSALLSSPLLCK
jgi:hypothetical protein